MDLEEFLTLLWISVVLYVSLLIIFMVTGCTVVVEHRYPPMPLLLDPPASELLERMDYASSPAKGGSTAGYRSYANVTNL